MAYRRQQAAFHQLRNESDVPGEPVELGHYEARLQTLAGGERGGELWPVIPFAALNLYEFFGEFPLPAIEEVEHGFALGPRPRPLCPCRSVETRR
jgi:hypothetical protein